MYTNPEYPASVNRLMPSGTNSTMFTDCCDVAICDDEPNCPVCKRKVVGWDAESKHERAQIRWRFATAHWNRKANQEARELVKKIEFDNGMRGGEK